MRHDDRHSPFGPRIVRVNSVGQSGALPAGWRTSSGRRPGSDSSALNPVDWFVSRSVFALQAHAAPAAAEKPHSLFLEQVFELLVGLVAELLGILAARVLQQSTRDRRDLFADVRQIPQAVDDQPLRFQIVFLQAGDHRVPGDAGDLCVGIFASHRFQVVEQFFRLVEAASFQIQDGQPLLGLGRVGAIFGKILTPRPRQASSSDCNPLWARSNCSLAVCSSGPDPVAWR